MILKSNTENNPSNYNIKWYMFHNMTCPERLHLLKENPESLHESGTFELNLEGFKISKQSLTGRLP